MIKPPGRAVPLDVVVLAELLYHLLLAPRSTKSNGNTISPIGIVMVIVTIFF